MAADTVYGDTTELHQNYYMERRAESHLIKYNSFYEQLHNLETHNICDIKYIAR
jgi:hypothetical protein